MFVPGSRPPEPVSITKRQFPERCPGAYSLHAYCDHENPAHDYDEFPHEADGQVQTLTQAKADLKRRGWVFYDDQTATCPKCVKALGMKRKG